MNPSQVLRQLQVLKCQMPSLLYRWNEVSRTRQLWIIESWPPFLLFIYSFLVRLWDIFINPGSAVRQWLGFFLDRLVVWITGILVHFLFCCYSGRVCEWRPSGSWKVQVLSQGAYGHVRQPPAMAQCGQRGKEGITSQEMVGGCVSCGKTLLALTRRLNKSLLPVIRIVLILLARISTLMSFHLSLRVSEVLWS